ncbi:hypothetical protein D8674_011644 [Pyrus ussuriensis x Pyrus communis]|uniref:Uncharacterized protein n=1 Tax=Pyrus ussuriensis x Pyrus communis TaxID=2448454 RepID=A0A5N5FZE5_9ROSA|nr:hypothetical protein D8674_011644 [Pyrus ussuriensis x Pyrus communis]
MKQALEDFHSGRDSGSDFTKLSTGSTSDFSRIGSSMYHFSGNVARGDLCWPILKTTTPKQIRELMKVDGLEGRFAEARQAYVEHAGNWKKLLRSRCATQHEEDEDDALLYFLSPWFLC